MNEQYTLRVTKLTDGFMVEIVELAITRRALTLELVIEEAEKVIARALMEQDSQAQAAGRAS